LLSRVRRIVVRSDYFLSRCLTEKSEEETERVWKGDRGGGGGGRGGGGRRDRGGIKMNEGEARKHVGRKDKRFKN